MTKFSLHKEEEEEEETIISKRRRINVKKELREEAKLGENSASSSSSSGIKARIDPDSLDCSICFNYLRPPLYQCSNGHVACSPCWTKLQNKCPVCTLDVSTRNIALEKILESITFPCSNTKWGCSLKSIPYLQKESHEENCRFRPFPCPIPTCTHENISRKYEHFVNYHDEFSQYNFAYNEPFKLKLNQSDSYFVLIGSDKSIFLLTNKPIDKLGHGLALYLIDSPHKRDYELSYEINVRKSTSKLQLKSEVNRAKDLNGGEYGVAIAFLMVPVGFCKSGIIEAYCWIRKS